MNKPNIGYWTRNAAKVRRIAVRTLPIYEQSASRYTVVALPGRFRAAVMAELDHYIGALPYHAGGSGNFFNGLMPTLAVMASVHVVLTKEGWTPEQVGRLSYDTFHAKFRRLPGVVRTLMRAVMVSPLLARKMRPVSEAMRRSGRSDTFFIDYSFARRPRRCSTMNCTQCGMVEFMRRNGLDGMLTYCNVFDFAQADACGMGLVQPACIGTGDADCTYFITRTPADTRYPEQLARILGLDMTASG